MRTKFSFWIALLCALFGPIFFPRLHLLYFAPYLVICVYKHSRLGLLWRASLCGIFLDLLSSTSHFGVSSLNYCFVASVLYGQKRNFFEDKLSTLPLMTFVFSTLSTGFSILLTLLFGNSHTLSWQWVATDLFGMSFVDALYSLIFSLPFQLFYVLRRMHLRRS